MFKKFICVLLVCFIFGCTQNKYEVPITSNSRDVINNIGSNLPQGYDQLFTGENGEIANIEKYTKLYQNKLVRIGVLLPLTGKGKSYGRALKNASLLAMEDLASDNFVLQFYDTKSTEQGAKRAVKEALKEDVKLIIGPLFSSSVKAIYPYARDKGVNIISFSTDTDVLNKGVFTLGLLVRGQVERVMSYARVKNYSRYALLVPDTKTGHSVAIDAINYARNIDAKVVKIGFYNPNSNDFSKIVRDITNYDIRHKRVLKARKVFEDRGEEDEIAQSNLKKLEPLDTLGGVDFDAVIIPEHGVRLRSAISMFGYYDVFSPKVRFLGTSIWDDENLNKEKTIIGSWYPTLPKTHVNDFNNKYINIFEKKPSFIASLAYDAVALAAVTARSSQEFNIKDITNPTGFFGVDGIFRMLPDGRNERGLNIYQVTSSGNVIVSKAPTNFDEPLHDYYEKPSFENDGLLSFSLFDGDKKAKQYAKLNKDGIAPQIFGKSNNLAEDILYGEELDKSQRFGVVNDEEAEELETIRLLEEMNIYINEPTDAVDGIEYYSKESEFRDLIEFIDNQ
jgi:ABC-type branched-subunit amino acid transport system substrate-binding protein